MKPDSETKQKLLQVALDLIWASSYGSVSVDDICTKAGVNKGSFYHAFKSKSDLAVAAFERHWESMRPRFDQVFSPQLHPLERIEKYCQMIVEGQKQKYQAFGKMLGCPFCSLGSELSTQDEKIRLRLEQMTFRKRKYLESVVRDLAAEGLIEVKDTEELAEGIMSYISGVLVQAKIENSFKQLERLHQGVIRHLGLKRLSPVTA